MPANSGARIVLAKGIATFEEAILMGWGEIGCQGLLYGLWALLS